MFHLSHRNQPLSYGFWLHTGEEKPAPDTLIAVRGEERWSVFVNLGGTPSPHLGTYLHLVSTRFLIKSDQSFLV